MIPEIVTMEWIAQDLGVPLSTVWTYHARAKRNRRDGTPRPGDLPPATMVGRTPTWTPAQYATWKANRPGQGAGGGRPRKSR